jgi:tetratricopeptide (TPR) repeat protein
MAKYTLLMQSRSPKPLTATLLAAILALLLACAASVTLADDLLDAQRLQKQGQLPQALEKVDAAIASKPKDAQGRFLKGLILAEMGRSTEAVAVFGKLAEDYPELPEPYNNLAVLYAQQKQYDKARTALEMAIRTHPGYAVAYDNLGDVHAKLASQAYEKALQLDASNKLTRSKLAMIQQLVSTSTSAAIKPGAAPRATAEADKVAVAVAPVAAARSTVAPTDKPAEKSLLDAEEARGDLSKSTSAVGSGDEAAVSKALQDWAAAWSRKDVAAYLESYASDFQTPNGMSRKAWEADRSERIGKSDKLLIEVDEVKVSFAGDKATARFKQHYSSPTAKGSVGKTIIFVKARGRWLILQERVG